MYGFKFLINFNKALATPYLEVKVATSSALAATAVWLTNVLEFSRELTHEVYFPFS